jgi:hypothetical protein
MAGPSTRLALNVRALKAASWLEFWVQRLSEKAYAQDAEFFKRRSGPLPLEQGEVRDFIYGMS